VLFLSGWLARVKFGCPVFFQIPSSRGSLVLSFFLRVGFTLCTEPLYPCRASENPPFREIPFLSTATLDLLTPPEAFTALPVLLEYRTQRFPFIPEARSPFTFYLYGSLLCRVSPSFGGSFVFFPPFTTVFCSWSFFFSPLTAPFSTPAP